MNLLRRCMHPVVRMLARPSLYKHTQLSRTDLKKTIRARKRASEVEVGLGSLALVMHAAKPTYRTSDNNAP